MLFISSATVTSDLLEVTIAVGNRPLDYHYLSDFLTPKFIHRRVVKTVVNIIKNAPIPTRAAIATGIIFINCS